jgi:DNA-binding NarL/FixJ family response regulator
MRVLLVGRPGDRDRIRAELLEAGVEIVAESATPPDATSPPRGNDAVEIDAIVTATARDSQAGVDVGEVDSHYVDALTAREHEVLALVAEGLPNKAIAQALGISDQTVKFHVASIIGKLGAVNRTDAVRRAIRRGLVAV